MDTPNLLELENVSKDFGGLRALSEVTFGIRGGEIVGLIGPNGSGKTTLLNVVGGIFPITGGKVFLQGENITGLKSHKVAAKGINRTFQSIRLFHSMSVLDNIIIGEYRRVNIGIFGGKKYWEQKTRIKEKALAMLQFVGLEGLEAKMAQSIPYGQKRLVELARALASDPTLLMVDEPVGGLNFEEKNNLIKILYRIRDKGITILMIEHNMDVTMKICDRLIVLSSGKMIFEGLPIEAKKSQVVIEAYLGRE
jgi:ABC-type branched-subunit amino acid transport system ATPase component